MDYSNLSKDEVNNIHKKLLELYIGKDMLPAGKISYIIRSLNGFAPYMEGDPKLKGKDSDRGFSIQIMFENGYTENLSEFIRKNKIDESMFL